MTGAVVKGLLLLLCGVALAALVVLFCLCRFLRRQREENRRLRQVLLLESHMEREELEALRRLRHDLRHYLRIAGGAMEEGRPGGLLEGTLERPLPAGGVLEALTRYYRGQGEQLGFQTDIRLELTPFQDALLPDLCLVVSNLLENAVEALQREGGGWLRARGIAAPGYVSLVVGNSCAQPLRIHNGRYLSSKGAGRTGVGLETVREVARRHGGSCSFSVCEGQFRAHVFLPTAPAAGCAKTAQAAPSDSGGSGRSASLPLGCWTVCATPLPPR
ncbi:GHKL domain-containing protein [Pseudoflavonifractor phocaeensis]|uniref:GHKL domain-containing protein n=1 Tax=Pseudoflavonifractor phocaeensis TaxID=1870988 RepID=UPI00195E4061|nr:GHKL domain-containing protein [Pseudoflavonifractor phocaeensis]MBM6723193.1 GHKL domain-containing protein [Pseudoflavonifractor phocaeensis]